MKYFLVFSFFQLALYANEIQPPVNEIQIAQINTSKKQIVLKTSQDLQAGQELIITNNESKQCSIIVIQKINEIVVADISKCEIMSTITTKDKVEPYIVLVPISTKEEVLIAKTTTPETVTIESDPNKYKKTIEIGLLSVSGTSLTLRSELETSGTPLLKSKENETKVNTLPLTFKIEIENDSQGFISDLNLKKQSGDLTLYGKINDFKVGGGLDIAYSNKTRTITNLGTTSSSTEVSSKAISPYSFIKKNLSSDEKVKVDIWAKAGIGFFGQTSEASTTTSELSYTLFYINPGIDFFFKVRKNMQVGLGANLNFGWLTGSIKSGTTENDGYGTLFNYNLDLLKLKYEF